MVQFYFLSIVLNALAGYILIAGDRAPDLGGGFSLNGETPKLIIGILSGVTGLLKILSVIEGDIPVIGDLFPAASGFLCGFILIFEYYRNRSFVGVEEGVSGHTESIDRVLLTNKKIIGVAALVAAVLHFLFPKVLLL